MYVCGTDGLEKVSVPVYIHSDVAEEAAKVAGKVLVDAKVWTSFELLLPLHVMVLTHSWHCGWHFCHCM